jgi:hypothetical protein
MKDGFPRKVAAFMAKNPPPPLAVWKEHWKSVVLFGIALRRRCWRFSFNGPVALDSKLVKREAKRAGIKLTPLRWQELEIMEGEAFEQMEKLRK